MKSIKKLENLRHSCAHLTAAAIKEIFPDAKFAIGPSIEDGFYYDFELPRALVPEDLKQIEKKMKDLAKKDLPFDKIELPIEEAKALAKKDEQTFKLELLDEMTEKKITLYKLGDFIDLCKGPHLKSTGGIRYFKLLSVAGAYWRGDEKNPMLQRIYGTCWETKKELNDYIARLDEAKKRDHRKIGKEMELFSFHPEAPGMVFWHPKGLIMFNLLVKRWREIQNKYEYKEVSLPSMLDINLWKKSGHYEHYKDGMFFTDNAGKKMALRPMDCPGTVLYYKEKLHSYNDLPLRLSELGTVFRNEQSGELHGLMRVQQITQDDAHIFATEDMIESEITEVIKIMNEIYSPFDIKQEIFLSTRPDDAMGDKKVWDKAEEALKSALKANNIKYEIKEKDGAFYGPKIDIQIKDSLGRTWQTGTIQLDFFMPKRFDIKYIGEDGKKHRPVMIHRALMGSLERFIGILTEHYGGAFPVWLTPVQAIVLPISDKHHEYANKVVKELKDFRVEVDTRDESVGKKIRDSEIQRIPYIIVVGDKEIKSKNITVRTRESDKLETIFIKDFIKKLLN